MHNLYLFITFLTKKILLPVLFVFFISGCQLTAKFSFQSLTAPSILLPADIKTIGFVDRNISFGIDTMAQYYEFNEIILSDSLNRDSIMAENCYWGFIESLSEYMAIDTIPLINLPKTYIEEKRTYPIMPWEMVDSLCAATGSDILVVLEDIQIYNKYSIIVDDSYYGLTDVNYFAVWRVYDPLYQKYHDERIVKDSLFLEVNSFSFNQIVENELPKRKSIFTDVSYEIGKQYAELLSPVWNDISRKYFVGGDNRFAVARYYIENEDWDSAISLWGEMSKEDDSKIAGRAAYNLALAYELREEYDIAGQWIQKSIGFYEKMKTSSQELKFAREYAIDLLKRSQNYQRLNQFFGE